MAMSEAELSVSTILNRCHWDLLNGGLNVMLLDFIAICQSKLQANKDTIVGLFTMSSFDSGHRFYPPTKSFQEIDAELSAIYTGDGFVDLLETFTFGRMPFVVPPNEELYKNKRMAIFVGGFTNLCHGYAIDFGKVFEEKGLAVDVVDIYIPKTPPPRVSISDHRFGGSELEVFVHTCNGGRDKGNSHIAYIGPKSSVRDVLSNTVLKKTLEKGNVDVQRRVEGEESSAAEDGN